jgi:transposase-like protein
MTKKKKTRRHFTEEFKAETVKLVKQSDRSMPSLAMELGINAKSVGECIRRSEESGDTVDESIRSI